MISTTTRQSARLFLIGGPDLRSYAAGADLNTDDHPRIEFNAPRYLYARTTALILADIIEHLESGYRRVPLSLEPPAAVTDELVEVPSLNLRVRAPGISSEDWKLEWLVSRSSFKDVDSLLQVGVTSQRLLEWRSDAVTTRAQAVNPEMSIRKGRLQDRVHAREKIRGRRRSTELIGLGGAPNCACE